jgi:putative restriction endonuclease
MLPTGPYAEGAHIRPLGGAHAGPDAPDNVLCLCANCYGRFDRGAIHISSTGHVIETATGTILGSLRTASSHSPSTAHIDYHRTHIALGP